MADDDSSYSSTDSSSEMYEECFGIPLMEVFSIMYLGNEAIVPEKQLGAVNIEYGTQYLYKVDHVDPTRPLFNKGDPVTLTVEAPFLLLEEFNINFDLFCGAYKDDICVEWENYYSDGVTIGEHRIKSLHYNGDICFQYGLFTNASVATLQLELINKSGSAQLYGFVVASNSRLDHPSRTSMLFWKRSQDKIQVGEDGLIPFSKSRVGVPLDSTFFVCISVNVDGKDYNASFALDPKYKEVSDVVCDQQSNFKLQVTWDVKKDSIISTYRNSSFN